LNTQTLSRCSLSRGGGLPHAQRYRGGSEVIRTPMSLSGTPEFQSGEQPLLNTSVKMAVRARVELACPEGRRFSKPEVLPFTHLTVLQIDVRRHISEMDRCIPFFGSLLRPVGLSLLGSCRPGK
jgi:hypothetical protein